jgi:hypothetical protein
MMTDSQHETLLTDEIQQRICAALAGNQFMATAAALVGISTKTVYGWLKKGAEGDPRYVGFVAEVEKAIAQGQGRLVQKIDAAAQQGSTADAKWLLERRYANEWGKKDRVEVGGDPSQPITVQLTWPGQGGEKDPDAEVTRREPGELPPAQDADVVDAVLVEDETDGNDQPSA